MLPLGSIVRKHDVPFHRFAVDVQVYLLLQVPTKDSLQAVLNYMGDVKTCPCFYISFGLLLLLVCWH